MVGQGIDISMVRGRTSTGCRQVHPAHLVVTMGGSGSKQAQLDKFGQLLSSQEKEVLNTCFLAIASAQEAESFGEEKLQVHTYDFGLQTII